MPRSVLNAPRRLVLLPVLVAAGVGAPLLVHPGTATAATVSSEAESFSLTAGAGMSLDDSRASAGKALLVWSNGTAQGTVSLATAATSLQVRARGDQCSGAPVVRVAVDGVAVGSRTVSATAWTTYTLGGTWAAGTHRVTLTFGNDYLAGCDRNLWLDRVQLVSPDVPVSARTFGMSAGGGSNRGLSTAVTSAATLGKKLERFNFYMAWEWNEAFPTVDMQAIDAAGALPEITWEPWAPGSAWQGKYALDNINNGSFDSYIDSFARGAAAYAKPMKLRFAHEMNGGWYPWGASVNGNTPAKYVAAYRHVHDRFVAVGARNVSWVWSMNVVDGMPTPLDQVYPGDAYVDEIGVDGYNGGTDAPSFGGWRNPQQIFAGTLAQVARIAPTKAVHIAETGSAVGGGDKAAWVTDLFAYLKTTQVKGVDWFEFTGFPDWRLTSSVAVSSSARSALTTW